jgi:para-nitrobenzyl esterase
MRTYWTNFAKTGDPNGNGLPDWPAYNGTYAQVLHIEAENTQAGPLVNKKGLEVLDQYFASRRI